MVEELSTAMVVEGLGTIGELGTKMVVEGLGRVELLGFGAVMIVERYSVKIV